MSGRDVACATKRQYPSKSQAKKSLKELRRMGRVSLAIYQCWHCELFHIGNPPGYQTYKRPGRVYG